MDVWKIYANIRKTPEIVVTFKILKLKNDVWQILTGKYVQNAGYCRHVHTYQYTETKANRKFP
jgi:hypothetical protein